MENNHMRLGTWRQLPVGATLDILHLDRNLGDTLWEKIKPEAARRFFRDCRMKVTKNNMTDLGGNTVFHSEGNPTSIGYRPLEILSTECDCWVPADDDGNVLGRHWTTYPDDTYIGWRGYALDWNLVPASGLKLFCPPACVCGTMGCPDEVGHRRERTVLLQQHAARLEEAAAVKAEAERVEAARLEERRTYGALRAAEARARKQRTPVGVSA